MAFPQVNFHRTNLIDFEYDCLRISAPKVNLQNPEEILSFCLTQSLTKSIIQPNPIDQKLTFDHLRKENITTEQLYQWSASIDLIEEYQEYLLSSHSLSQSNNVFYNCTKPRFGPLCQYEFLFLPSDKSTLNEVIINFYRIEYNPTSLTCYEHLKCDRGSKSLCLDWTEICNNYIDCTNNQIDENDCWQVQMNECREDEYRCRNGQCVSKQFVFGYQPVSECLIQSSYKYIELVDNFVKQNLPMFYFEDVICRPRENDKPFHLYQTVTCDAKRRFHLKKFKEYDVPKMLSGICFFTFACQYGYREMFQFICNDICADDRYRCISIVYETCPELISFTASPIAFGHVYAVFSRDITHDPIEPIPDYICYDEKLCQNFDSNSVELQIYDSKTCRRTRDTPIEYWYWWNWENDIDVYESILVTINLDLLQCNSLFYDNSNIRNSSFFYCCQNSSRCISIDRLCDGYTDCEYDDDEICSLINDTCLPMETDALYKCPFNNKCISSTKVLDNACDCIFFLYPLKCEDELDEMCDLTNLHTCNKDFWINYILYHISFETMCDGVKQLFSITINETEHTDETECEYWQCNNTYTRCDGRISCLNYDDELNCDEYPVFKCPFDYHLCWNGETYEIICVPTERPDYDQMIYLNHTYAPQLCHTVYDNDNSSQFHCDTINNDLNITNCSGIHTTDPLNFTRQFSGLSCDEWDAQNDSWYSPFNTYESSYSIIYKCSSYNNYKIDDEYPKFFSLGKTENEEVEEEENFVEDLSVIKQTFAYDFECHRGYPLRLWLDYNRSLTDIICLCPLSYYGSYCQFQNQRVSLTLLFETFPDSRRTIFSVVIQLIDNTTQRQIHSSKQLTYIHLKHCQRKFNLYLTYSTRPKQTNKTYSIQIDIYEKSTIGYRGSVSLPLKFPILPVHRVAYFLTIPQNNQLLIVDCPKNQLCFNGQCIKYVDSSDDRIFCRCHSGWSGKDCSIRYECSCSNDSSCIGIGIDNRSICICPLDRWGPRCFLRNRICESVCLNKGQCVLIDDEMISSKKFFCICPKGFSGDRCEIEDSKIIVSFDKEISLSENMLVHFIEVRKNGPIRNGSTYQSIPLYQNEIIIRWSRRFHIVFTQLSNKNYYLIDVNKDYNRSKVIRKQITSSDRCSYINEYLNETIVNYPLIRRMKYFHVPCQNLISCFYDQNHFCLCNQFGYKRIANCFEFNSTFEHDCLKLSTCQHGSQCLQDDIRCPQTYGCVCDECSYGSLCQFQSSSFDLSLDGILGSHIQPNVSIQNQSSIIKITLSLIVIMSVIGIVNGMLSLFAFQSKETRKVGCGYYLLGSSITTLFTSIMLVLKFSILLVSQMSMISNRNFLSIQCYLFDYLLQIVLNLDRWLNGCVAIERSVNIVKGVKFNKNKSKTMAKYVICLLILLTTISSIYDPIHRQLVDDVSNDEQPRLWCIVSYSSQILLLNQIIQMFHFFVPFIMNIISSLIIIILSTKRRRSIEEGLTFYEILCEQIREHQHLLIAPFVLIMLLLPRLIISFVAGCMQSNRSPWLYLIAYLISFVPPMLTFIIFVLPSKLYKEEFRKTIKKYINK